MIEPKPATIVKFPISAELLFKHLLQFPDEPRVMAANVDHQAGTIDLFLAMPDAPPGATALDADYVRHHGITPWELIAFRWFGPDGRAIPVDEPRETL